MSRIERSRGRQHAGLRGPGEHADGQLRAVARAVDRLQRVFHRHMLLHGGGCHGLCIGGDSQHRHTPRAFVGALEVCDPLDLDLAPHLPLATTVARLVAHALDVATTSADLDDRRRTMRELIGLSQAVARATDLQSFVKTVAERVMTATNADYVDIWRAKRPDSSPC